MVRFAQGALHRDGEGGSTFGLEPSGYAKRPKGLLH